MIELIIDTATAACSVALIENGRIVAERHEVVGRGHAERLIPQIAELIEGRERPTVIRVDCGPGSFTGVRVGLAAARALAMAWRVPVHGYSAMALLAASAFARSDAPEVLCVATIGGHGEWFIERFARVPFAVVAPLASLPPAEAARCPEALVIGSAATALVALRGWGEARDDLPRAAEAIMLPPAFATLPPRPMYGRAPDAKVSAAKVPGA